MMIHGGRYDKREDFAIVVQPFFQNTNMPLDRVSHHLLPAVFKALCQDILVGKVYRGRITS